VKDKFLRNNLCSKILCTICYNQQHQVSCKILQKLHTRQATEDADDSNSRVVSAMFSLPLRETSSSLGLCITRGQRDHVIAPHSIFSWYVRQVSGQDRVSCTGQFIGSAHIAVLPEAITKGYGVFLRILTTITHICIGRDKGAAKVSSYTDIRII
jgi:hypothetical protein